jgi:hypothetical protein
MTPQLAANRANSLLSTGPRTEDGKRKSSMNAVKTGLTGVTVLLSSDDAAEYQRHITAYQNEFQPAGLEESELVQSLADISWRLRRIPGLEMAIYARGTVMYADYFEEKDPDVRRSLIEVQTHLIYEKQLRNLQLQEARLVRRREKETPSFAVSKRSVNNGSRKQMASNFQMPVQLRSIQNLRNHLPPMRMRPMFEHIQTLPRTQRHPSINYRNR